MIEHLLFYELSLWKNAHQCTTNPDAIDYGSLFMLYISDMLVSLSGTYVTRFKCVKMSSLVLAEFVNS